MQMQGQPNEYIVHRYKRPGFVVTIHTQMDPREFSVVADWVHSVPIVLRYEFTQQLPDDPCIIAKISRCLDPAVKQTSEWNTFSKDTQDFVENMAKMVTDIKPFLNLKFEQYNSKTNPMSTKYNSRIIFSFVYESGLQMVAPNWTSFECTPAGREVLHLVSFNMTREFQKSFIHV